MKRFLVILMVLFSVSVFAQDSKFVAMDENGDGILTKDEYFETFYVKDKNDNQNIESTEIKGNISKSDFDGDGLISAIEYLMVFANKDINEDGVLTEKEFLLK